MIAHIDGVVTEKYGNFLIVDVSGVGYEMMVPTPDYEAVTVGERRKFFTYHAVRENSEELYGFSSLAAKKIFELLISVARLFAYALYSSRRVEAIALS